MEHLGRHVLLELYNCNRERLDDLVFLRNTMLSAAEEVGATVINDVFHQFSPQGVTGVVAIAESHLCIHTWPEYGYAAVDIFTCGENFDPKRAAALIIQRLESRNPELKQVERGMIDLATLKV